MTTGLDVFDATVQQTNLWLKDLMARIPTTDRHYAYQLLRATLHTFRDRIGPENAVHFGAQLPMLIRGFYYEGWQPDKPQTKTRHLDDFLAAVEEEAGRSLGAGAGGKVKAVFAVIADKIDAHEIEKLRKVLPAELKGPAARRVLSLLASGALPRESGLGRRGDPEATATHIAGMLRSARNDGGSNRASHALETPRGKMRRAIFCAGLAVALWLPGLCLAQGAATIEQGQEIAREVLRPLPCHRHEGRKPASQRHTLPGHSRQGPCGEPGRGAWRRDYRGPP